VLAAKHAQQVCGGIGFTWEHGLHRSVRRAYVLDSILGPSTALQEEVGRRLVDTHRVPRLGHLEGAAVARAG
jgi:alkylation response protein AidB-like acyl-CoA dehydrogenase